MTQTRAPKTFSEGEALTDVQPGDVVTFLSEGHLIADIDDTNALGHPIARAADGWGISMPEHDDQRPATVRS